MRGVHIITGMTRGERNILLLNDRVTTLGSQGKWRLKHNDKERKKGGLVHQAAIERAVPGLEELACCLCASS
jgi:hypothetical protein